MTRTSFNSQKTKSPVDTSLRISAFIVGLSTGAIVLSLFFYYFQYTTPLFNISANNVPLYLVIFIGGIPLISQIFLKIIKGNIGADLLAAISIITATVLGEYLAATLIILMLSSGQVFETYAMRRASSVLLLLAERMPSIVHRKDLSSSAIKDISLAEIQVDDLCVIYPHEVCPVDGVVVEGHGSMDESYLTGEPYQVSKIPGVRVLSGSVNGSALLIIRAEAKPEDSRYANIMKVMEESEQHRPQMRRLADQLGGIFAPIALIAALIVWYYTGESLRFLSVLVIATPCPLLIAIPITVISSISLAAKRGIIIKDPTVLERLPLCRTAIFDKTGTLTYGQAELIEMMPAAGFDVDSVLQLTASLECFSKHPLSQAILMAAQKASLTLLPVEEISEIPGQGLSGKVQGHLIQVTSRKKWMLKRPDQKHLLPLTKPGLECLVLVDDQFAAICVFRDTLRLEGGAFIRHLSPMHHFNKIMITSGDRSSEVDYLAKELDISLAYSNQSPEEKVELIRKEALLAPTLFMGDGINDAPALTAATVGIAFGQGSITAEAGGAVILESSLVKVDELIHISALMRKIALQSALGGMALSFIGMGFAAAGYIGPVAGALIQEVIDVLAILNALRLTWISSIQSDLGKDKGGRIKSELDF